MYRPQFVYLDAPKETRDVRCTYSFDSSNTAPFQGTIPNNNPFSNPIKLTLDQDADFFLRGIEVAETNLLIGLLDPFNNQVVEPLTSGFPPTLEVELWASTDGSEIEALESDNWGIFCPAGSSLIVYVQNNSGGPLNGPIINLHGIKRYCGDICK